MAVAVVLGLVSCTGPWPTPADPSAVSSYDDAVARIPLAAAEVARLFEALNHMLIFGPVSRERSDLDLLPLITTDALAERAHRTHAGVRGTNPDPWFGPRWLRVLDVRIVGDSATVFICTDEGYHGPVSRGGGREVWREFRAVLVRYELVRDPDLGGAGRWLVGHDAAYAGDDYRDRDASVVHECEQWANHDLTDVE